MIPEAAKQYIGRMDPPVVREVEKGAIRRYAAAFDNQNPLYYDEEHARDSRYGCIVAPPGFFGWPAKSVASAVGLPDVVVDLQAALADAGFPRILDGGISYDFFLPVRAGDTLVASTRIEDISEKEGKTGTMLMCRFQTSYLSQNGDLVVTSRQTFFMR